MPRVDNDPNHWCCDSLMGGQGGDSSESATPRGSVNSANAASPSDSLPEGLLSIKIKVCKGRSATDGVQGSTYLMPLKMSLPCPEGALQPLLHT